MLFLELLVSIYVGYFGAGVGILFLSLLALLGLEDIHALNGMKTLLVSIVNGVALLTWFVFARVIAFAGAADAGRGATGFGDTLWRRLGGAKWMNPQHVRVLVIVIGFWRCLPTSSSARGKPAATPGAAGSAEPSAPDSAFLFRSSGARLPLI